MSTQFNGKRYRQAVSHINYIVGLSDENVRITGCFASFAWVLLPQEMISLSYECSPGAGDKVLIKCAESTILFYMLSFTILCPVDPAFSGMRDRGFDSCIYDECYAWFLVTVPLKEVFCP